MHCVLISFYKDIDLNSKTYSSFSSIIYHFGSLCQETNSVYNFSKLIFSLFYKCTSYEKEIVIQINE